VSRGATLPVMQGSAEGASTGGFVTGIVEAMLQSTAEADLLAAERRVAALRSAHPEVDTDGLVARSIARAVRAAALSGAATSGAAVIPGVGTLAALTLGAAADLRTTLRLQTRLVLDVGVLRGAELDPARARAAVLLVAGASRASTLALGGAGRAAIARLAAYGGARTLMRAVPLLGVIALAGGNALATELIGRRADAFFRRGPSALDDWREGVAAATGIDPRTWAGRLPRLPRRWRSRGSGRS
jgi:hypothetical protein